MKKPSLWFCAGLVVVLLGSAGSFAQSVLAKKGTLVYGTLQQTLDSKTNHDGDVFTLAEKETWFHHTAALRGGVIEGHLEGITPASATHKATMSVIFDDVRMPDGTVAPIHAGLDSISTFEPKTHHLRDVGVIIGSAVVGHYAGKKLGVKHGGLAGAAAGFALVSTMKSNIDIKKGTLVKLRLTSDVTAGVASH